MGEGRVMQRCHGAAAEGVVADEHVDRMMGLKCCGGDCCVDDDDDEGKDKTLQRIADSESSNKTSALNERHRQKVTRHTSHVTRHTSHMKHSVSPAHVTAINRHNHI